MTTKLSPLRGMLKLASEYTLTLPLVYLRKQNSRGGKLERSYWQSLSYTTSQLSRAGLL